MNTRRDNKRTRPRPAIYRPIGMSRKAFRKAAGLVKLVICPGCHMPTRQRAKRQYDVKTRQTIQIAHECCGCRTLFVPTSGRILMDRYGDTR